MRQVAFIRKGTWLLPNMTKYLSNLELLHFSFLFLKSPVPQSAWINTLFNLDLCSNSPSQRKLFLMIKIYHFIQ